MFDIFFKREAITKINDDYIKELLKSTKKLEDQLIDLQAFVNSSARTGSKKEVVETQIQARIDSIKNELVKWDLQPQLTPTPKDRPKDQNNYRQPTELRGFNLNETRFEGTKKEFSERPVVCSGHIGEYVIHVNRGQWIIEIAINDGQRAIREKLYVAVVSRNQNFKHQTRLINQEVMKFEISPKVMNEGFMILLTSDVYRNKPIAMDSFKPHY
jgi:hypothetical protein